MSRIDVPTLRCDRCLAVTQDINEMSSYQKLVMFKDNKLTWDLCPECWQWFITAMDVHWEPR